MENCERFMNVHVRVCACFFAGLNDLVLEPLRKLFFSSQVYVKVSQYLFFFLSFVISLSTVVTCV